MKSSLRKERAQRGVQTLHKTPSGEQVVNLVHQQTTDAVELTI